MRPSGLHQAIRGGIVATCEMTHAVLPVARVGAVLPLRAVLLALTVLAMAGCATETPPAAPTTSSPQTLTVAERSGVGSVDKSCSSRWTGIT